MKGSQTALYQEVNGHQIGVTAIQREGEMISEKDLRDVQNYLTAKGFRVIFFKRGTNILSQIGETLFG